VGVGVGVYVCVCTCACLYEVMCLHVSVRWWTSFNNSIIGIQWVYNLLDTCRSADYNLHLGPLHSWYKLTKCSLTVCSHNVILHHHNVWLQKAYVIIVYAATCILTCLKSCMTTRYSARLRTGSHTIELVSHKRTWRHVRYGSTCVYLAVTLRPKINEPADSTKRYDFN
jgi:hypothetical protein